jgi:hypothetical protein
MTSATAPATPFTTTTNKPTTKALTPKINQQVPKSIDLIVVARPNFMKISPIIRAMEKARAPGDLVPGYRRIHTGQHYDTNMSGSFF